VTYHRTRKASNITTPRRVLAKAAHSPRAGKTSEGMIRNMKLLRSPGEKNKTGLTWTRRSLVMVAGYRRAVWHTRPEEIVDVRYMG